MSLQKQLDEDVERTKSIFIECCGRKYHQCELKLRKECPIEDICYEQQSGALSGQPHRKLLYLSPFEIADGAIKSEFREELDRYIVYLEVGK